MGVWEKHFVDCKLCADIIISTNNSFIVLALKKVTEHNFMMLSLSSLLVLVFVLEGDSSDRP